MLVELIVTGMISQAVAHYGKKIFSALDNNVQGIFTRAAEGDATAKEEANEIVIREVRDPETAKAIVKELSDLPDLVEAPTPALQLYGAKLNGTFNMVRGLPSRVVALPGWFHTVDCVTVIDARPASDGRWSPPFNTWDGPQYSRPNDPQDEHFSFPATTSAEVFGTPRVWIIDCTSDERDEFIERIQAGMKEPGSVRSAGVLPYDLADSAGVDAERVRRLASLYEHRLETGPILEPPTVEPAADESIADSLLRRLHAPSTSISRSISEPDGIIAMQDALRDLVTKETARQLRWAQS